MYEMTAIQPTRRSWFQFSLRTLLLATTLLACWLSSQRNTVDERRRLTDEIGILGHQNQPNSVWLAGDGDNEWQINAWGRLPWAWRVLGAKAVVQIRLDAAAYTVADAARIAKLFPEALEVERVDDK